MKTFIISLVILVLIITGGVIYTYVLDKVVETATQDVTKIEQAIKTEDFENAAQDLSALDLYWQKHRPLLTAMIDHSHLSVIDSAIADLAQNIYYSDAKDASGSAAILKEQLKGINSNEQLKLQNIF